MTDIVERLLNWLNQSQKEQHETAIEAAGEINMLRHQRNRLLSEMRKALHYCKDDMPRTAAVVLLDAMEAKDHSAPSQSSADPSQCPTSKTK